MTFLRDVDDVIISELKLSRSLELVQIQSPFVRLAPGEGGLGDLSRASRVAENPTWLRGLLSKSRRRNCVKSPTSVVMQDTNSEQPQ